MMLLYYFADHPTLRLDAVFLFSIYFNASLFELVLSKLELVFFAKYVARSARRDRSY